jgi:hypothetical protein
MRADEVAVLTGVGPGVRLGPEPVHDHQLTRSRDHVREVRLFGRHQLVSRVDPPGTDFRLRVRQAVHDVYSGASHVNPAECGQGAFHEEEVHEVV